MALVFIRPHFWLALLAVAVALILIAYRWRLRWLPAWFLRLLLLAVILFVIFTPREQLVTEPLPARQVLLLDQSDSISQDARDHSREEAARWLEAGANRVVVAFGADVATLGDARAAWPAIDGRGTALPQALEHAGALLGQEPGIITLASDGVLDEAGEAGRAVADLAAAGHRLDIVHLDSDIHTDDVVADSLWAPQLLWEGASFTTFLTVHALQATEATVQLDVNDVAGAPQALALREGVNIVPLTVSNPALGLLTMNATVTADGDPRPLNNSVHATAQVFNAPQVLFVSELGSLDVPFAAQLQAAGVDVTGVSPQALPTDLDTLLAYKVIFLNDLLAQSLSPEQMLALKVFVEDHGGGLVFLGGLNSYTLGGYKNTLLAPLLPVALEPPPRQDRIPITFVIIFDRSSSMNESQPDIPAIRLAREAAVRAIEVVDAQDYIGVMTYATDVRWDVPLTAATGGLALRRAQDTIGQVNAGGGTALLSALSEAVAGIGDAKPTDKGLILVLSDGRSSGLEQEYQEIVRQARALGMNISTILLGQDERAAELMALIATEGNGRFHQVLNAGDLPRIMVEEGQAARGDNVQEGMTGLAAGEPGHPVLAGINPANMPALAGYNALTSRADEGAEDILVSASFGDPLLSGWQVGLGRVVAWMGDAGVDWAAGWAGWEGSGALWAQIVRYALLNPGAGQAQVDVQADSSELMVNVRLLDRLSRPHNWGQPRFVFAVNDDEAQILALPQSAPGAYRVSTSAPEPGAYRALVGYVADGAYHEAPVAFAVNYPAEWGMPDVNQGLRNLAVWANMTGGRETTLANMTEPAVAPEPFIETDRLLWNLMLALIVSWPIEIALRRRWLPWVTG